MNQIPSAAQVVIIGGGIIGCSTAYHLARLGFKDIVLLERAKLTSGSTWHAAGLVGQLRTSANVTQLLKYSVELYDKLEKETGQATGWKRNGGLRLACNPERLTEIKRQATTAHSFGLEMHVLSPARGEGAMADHGHQRCRGCRVSPHRRPGQSLRSRAGVGQGRAHAGRENYRGVPGHRFRCAERPSHAGCIHHKERYAPRKS